jgi:hypothetical protein
MEDAATPLDGPADGLRQHIVLEQLGQELDGPRLHRLHGHRHVAVAGDELDGPSGVSADPLEPAAIRELPV